MLLTKLSLAGNILIISAHREFRKWHPDGDGKTANLFLQCNVHIRFAQVWYAFCAKRNVEASAIGLVVLETAIFIRKAPPVCLSQSKELTRGATKFVYKGSSHRRKSAAWHKFYMVWLYRRRWAFYSFKWLLPAFARLRGGGGGSAPHGVYRRWWGGGEGGIAREGICSSVAMATISKRSETMLR